MHFSDKGFHLPSPKLGNDENSREIGRIRNPNFGGETLNRRGIKHFMAPTVSAASKAVSPSRKRILCDRNSESISGFSFPNAKNQESLNLDLNFNLKQSGICDSSAILSSPVGALVSPSRVLECGDGNGDGKGDLCSDLSSRPYDPLTNYLSPRPKFLRYNPNRRREALYVRSCGDGEGKAGFESESTSGCSDSVKGVDDDDDESSVSGGGLSRDSPSLEGWLDRGSGGDGNSEVVDNDGGKEEQGDEVDEEVDEDGSCCGLKGVLKLLLVLVVLVLSAASISSMNSPTPPPAIQFMRGLKIEDITLKAALVESFKAERALEFMRGMKDDYLNVSVRNFEGESVLRFMRGLRHQWLKIVGRISKVVPVKVSEAETEQLDDTEEPKMDGFDDVTGYIIGDIGRTGLVGAGDVEKYDSEGVRAQGLEREMADENLADIELREIHISERIESMEDYYVTRLYDVMTNQPMFDSAKAYGPVEVTDSRPVVDHGSAERAEKAKISIPDETKAASVHKKDKIRGIEVKKMAEPSIEARKIDKLPVEVQKTQLPIEMTQNTVELAIEAEKAEQLPSEQVEFWLVRKYVTLAAVVSFGVLVSLIPKICSKFKKAAPTPNELNVMPSKAGTPQKSSSVFVSEKTKAMKQNDQVDSLIDPLSNIHLEEDIIVKDATPLRVRGPRVELLGEVVFGEVSNPLKSCSMRSVTMNGVEESSGSISQPRRLKGSRDYASSTRWQVSASEISTTDAPSRSFTIEEKETRGSAKNVLTPVRRSSRIRIRGVTPPSGSINSQH